MRSLADYYLYNTQNPDVLAPKAKKPMPFPLENIDEEIAAAYNQVNQLMLKFEAAKKNPVNNTNARTSRVESLCNKTKTCLHLLKSISAQYQDLWF